MQAGARHAPLERAIQSLTRLADLFERRREQLAREVDLTLPQWRLLEEVSSEQFMPSLFARRRERSPAAVSKILRQLLGKGLLVVAISPRDGRQRDYALTAKGRRTLAHLQRSRRRAIAAIWADLDPRRLERFAEFGAELARRMERYMGSSSRSLGKTTRVSKTS